MDAPRGYELSISGDEARTTVAVRGRVEVHEAGRLLTDLGRAARGRARELALDLGAVDYFDSSGGAVLLLLRRQLESRGGRLRIVGSRPEIDHLLQLVDPDAIQRAVPPRKAPLPARLAVTRRDLRGRLHHVLLFVGEVALGLVDAVRHPGRMRWRETLVEIQRAGAESLPIVALIGFLVGVITAFQGLVQLRQFGADIYVANLVGLSMTRELGPLMTAIIASGRSGASYAAELGTMKVSEEIDALVTLGLDRTRFLITPKVIALVLMLPCLTIFADLIGIAGGMLVAESWIDLSPDGFLQQLQRAMRPRDFLSGLVKSVIFGVIVACVGCLRGLQATGGAESVGQVTTSAVVTGLTLIIAFDACLTLIFNYWGI